MSKGRGQKQDTKSAQGRDGKPDPMERDVMADIRSGLINIAATLVRCEYLPSEYVDDYPQKTYSASRVARMMAKPHEKSKDMAVELRKLIDRLP